MHGYPALVIDKWSQGVPASTHRPSCIGCGEKMWLSVIEPGQPGHDIRTFECPRCHHQVTEVVKIG
jgi:hypothetical protein